jgi:hypothetical protein
VEKDGESLMKKSLNLNPNIIPYSKGEMMLFNMLPKDGGRITSEQLASAKQKKSEFKITYPRNSIASTMKSLMMKIEKNGEPFRVLKSPQQGPHPTKFWIVNKPARQRA